MLRYMKYAYAVYREGSFSGAAKKLYISQPALSLTIRKLEQEVGYPIFQRRGRSVTLTPPGEKYIRAVEEILRIREDLERELEDMRTLQKGQLSIACSAVMAGTVLPRVLKDYMARYPQIKIDLRVESSQVLSRLLEEGGVDIVIDNTQGQKSFAEYVSLFTEEILLAVPAEFSVNRQLEAFRLMPEALEARAFDACPRIPVTVLAEEPFILLKPGNKMRYIADAVFREQAFHPKTVFEFDRVDTAVSFTDNGFGVSFVTNLAVDRGRCPNTCFYLPDTAFSRREVYAMYRKNQYLSQAAKAFLETFREKISLEIPRSC